MFNTIILILTLVCIANISTAFAITQEAITFHGSSDSSAAFAIDGSRFVVADDENNILRVYDEGKPSLPVQTIDSLQKFLADVADAEADIEASAVIGDTVYWIGSHGRNKKGKLRLARHVICAAKFEVADSGELKFNFIGKPYRRLLHDLVGCSFADELSLGKIAKLDDSSEKSLAPKKDGVNIEGMTAGSDGALYIGFRNPLFDGKALVVKLMNPYEVVSAGQRCRFEGPILLDLKERGIRSMEYDRKSELCYIIAGEKDSENDFSVYSWQPKSDSKLIEVVRISPENRFNPEAAFIRGDKLYLLSDDGAMPVKVGSPAECVPGEMQADGTCANKHLADQDAKTFRLKVYTVK